MTRRGLKPKTGVDAAPSDDRSGQRPRRWSSVRPLVGGVVVRWWLRRGVVVVSGLLLAGCTGAPSIFAARGESASEITALGWFMTFMSLGVILVVTVLLLYALFRRRPQLPSGGQGEVDLEAERGGRRAILAGTVLSTLILLVALIWTVRVLVRYTGGLDQTALTVKVTGYRYWWALEYLDDAGDPDFITANELHIPAGTRVRLVLEAGDVIHSFWVPELAGKMDLIPGQTNVMWISADEPGLYRGQCAEFCGTSHANMLIRVVVQDPEAYRGWTDAQRLPAQPDSAGMRLFQAEGCGACHRIMGSVANGRAGPDLTHLASRQTLAAGILPNNPENLSRWLANPSALKPGVLMPATGLEGERLNEMVSFLENLR